MLDLQGRWPGLARQTALLLLWFVAAPAAATPPGGGVVLHAVRVQGEIRVDGRLDEPAWLTAKAAGGFLQRDPEQGEPATEPTELRLLFDDHALYAGVRLEDSAGVAISTASRSSSTPTTTTAPASCSR